MREIPKASPKETSLKSILASPISMLKALYILASPILENAEGESPH